MPDLPVMLRLVGCRCVIVGGGAVALRKARLLAACEAKLVIIAPEIDTTLAELGQCVRRGYETGDLRKARLVVTATDDPAVNQRVADDAAALGVLINRADAPSLGDVTIPAHAHHGPITLAVHTDNISSTAAGEIRRQLSAALPEHWPAILALVSPYRHRIQQACPDGSLRTALLRQLADEAMIRAYEQHGPTGVTSRCEDLLARADKAAQ